MLRYVNHDSIHDMFAFVEAEPDPQSRAAMLNSMQQTFISALAFQYGRTAYELKTAGWNTGQISDLLELSERRIKRLIADYSSETGNWNPLQRRTSSGAIDISHLVLRQHASQPTVYNSDATIVAQED